MFKIMTLTALSLILSQAAFAKYVCHNNDNTLTIEHTALSVDGLKSEVIATLTTPTSKEVFTGTYNLASKIGAGYSMNNAQGEPVGIEITKVQSYGGRCGRCGDGGFVTTYALLTLPQAETVDFVCD